MDDSNRLKVLLDVREQTREGDGLLRSSIYVVQFCFALMCFTLICDAAMIFALTSTFLAIAAPNVSFT